MVKRDENEKNTAKKKGPSKDGGQILTALTKDTLEDAIDVLMDYKGQPLKGHTFVASPTDVISLEQTSKHKCVRKSMHKDRVYVRTNHGIDHEGAGYQNGDSLLSSLVRKENALKILDDLDMKPEDIAPAFYNHDYRNPEFNIVRDAKLYTSSQMILNLSEPSLSLYLIEDRQTFVGIENRLPEGHKAQIKIRVYRYGKDGKPVEDKKPKLAGMVAREYLRRY
jgi:hypothetical protein